eukprot:192849_1
MNYKTVGILVLAVCLVSSVSGANYDFIKGRKDRISSHLELEDKKEHKECKGGEKCEPLKKIENKNGEDYVCSNGTSTQSLYEYLTEDTMYSGDKTFPSGICVTKFPSPIADPTVFFDLGCACPNQRLRTLRVYTSSAIFAGSSVAIVFCTSEGWDTHSDGIIFCSTAI